MKNFEKYKTVDERAKAFSAHCEKTNCEECGVRDKSNGELGCVLGWLDFEYKDEMPLPCPFCGSECELHEIWDKEECKSVGHNVRCTMCEYKSPWACEYDGSDAIAAHNRVARAVMAKKEERMAK